MSVQLQHPQWLDPKVWPYPIRSLDTGNFRIAYTDVGSGPPLFFLNVPQWSMVWRDVIYRLQGDFRCISLDAPGLGLSERVPPHLQRLTAVRDAVVALTDHIGVTMATLVVHDLGGLSGLAAAAHRPDAFHQLIAVNTFGWRPDGILLPIMLRLFGSAPVRWLDAATRLLPIATSGRFGVGRKMDHPSRRAYRQAFDREAIATMHRYFADAARNGQIHREAALGLEAMASRPAITVFGAWGDYLGFARRWRRRLPALKQHSIPRSFHFPMNDDPEEVATIIAKADHPQP